MYDIVLQSVWCMSWFSHLSDSQHDPFICLMRDLVDSSVICLIHLHTLPINDICNACYQSTNHWCNRGSRRSLGCPDSLQLVATWCKMVLMIGDSDVDIFNSRSHAPLIIQSLTRSLMYCWECLHATYSIYHRHFRIIMTVGLQHYPIQLSDVRWRRWLWWWWRWV